MPDFRKIPGITEPVVLGPHVPDEWIECPRCNRKTLHRITARAWMCICTNSTYIMYRSQKVWKLIGSDAYNA